MRTVTATASVVLTRQGTKAATGGVIEESVMTAAAAAATAKSLLGNQPSKQDESTRTNTAQSVDSVLQAKTDAPKKAPAKKAAPKKPAAKKAVKAKSGFSVKDWWRDNVLNGLPGSKAPR